MIKKEALLRDDSGDVLFEIEYGATEFNMIFEVFEAVKWELNNPNPLERQLYLEGYIRWDCYSDLHFDTNGYYKYFSCKYDFEKHCKMMMALYEKAATTIKNFDRIAAES